MYDFNYLSEKLTDQAVRMLSAEAYAVFSNKLFSENHNFINLRNIALNVFDLTHDMFYLYVYNAIGGEPGIALTASSFLVRIFESKYADLLADLPTYCSHVTKLYGLSAVVSDSYSDGICLDWLVNYVMNLNMPLNVLLAIKNKPMDTLISYDRQGKLNVYKDYWEYRLKADGCSDELCSELEEQFRVEADWDCEAGYRRLSQRVEPASDSILDFAKCMKKELMNAYMRVNTVKTIWDVPQYYQKFDMPEKYDY